MLGWAPNSLFWQPPPHIETQLPLHCWLMIRLGSESCSKTLWGEGTKVITFQRPYMLTTIYVSNDLPNNSGASGPPSPMKEWDPRTTTRVQTAEDTIHLVPWLVLHVFLLCPWEPFWCSLPSHVPSTWRSFSGCSQRASMLLLGQH